MTDSDLLMVENLIYLGSEQLEHAGVTKSLEQCDSIGEFLSQFDEQALSKLDSGNAQDQEWAARIRYMQKNKEICSLIVKEYNSDVHCFLFEDPNNPGHAIVAFEGTRGGDEWKDNVEGLIRADTNAQMKAKAYIDSLGYESITVTGHSKGGNKAMYVAITCDKVDRCVAYDGQGFSKKFIDKYSAEIQNRASIIKNYSLSNDYVHILMFPIPGAQQIYMEPGNRVNNFGEAHYAIGPFRLYEVDGKWYIDEEGGIIHIASGEDPAMTLLHNLTTFIMNNASEEELAALADNLLGPLLKGLFGTGDDHWSTQQIVAHILANRDEAILLVAYLLKYIKVNNLGIDDIINIVKALGLSEDDLWQIVAEIIEKKTGVRVSAYNVKILVEKILEKLFDQITDGKDDRILAFLIGLIGGAAGRTINSVWKLIEDKYSEINVLNGADNYVATIRDYSISVYNTIISAIDAFEKNSLPDVTSWNGYSGESWFSKLSVAVAVKCVNGYKNKLSEINAECRKRVNTTFDNIENVDKIYSGRMDFSVSNVKTLTYQIRQG